MPIKTETEKFRIPPEQDRRRKLSDDQKDEIRELHSMQGWSQRALAQQFGVSRRLIQFIVDPEAEKRARDAHRERQKEGRYYDREKHTEQVRATRKHRQSLMEQGLLMGPEKESDA